MSDAPGRPKRARSEGEAAGGAVTDAPGRPQRALFEGEAVGGAVPWWRHLFAGRGRAAAWAGGAAIVTAGLGGLATDLSPWYYALRQPPWKPPDWLFGPAWTLIYTLTASAAVLAWEACPPGARRRWLLVAFASNAVLNIVWSWLFFTLRRPDWARVEVMLLLASVALLVVLAGRLRPRAGWLLLPYLLWTAFAGWLNCAVVRLNA